MTIPAKDPMVNSQLEAPMKFFLADVDINGP